MQFSQNEEGSIRGEGLPPNQIDVPSVHSASLGSTQIELASQNASSASPTAREAEPKTLDAATESHSGVFIAMQCKTGAVVHIS